FYLEIGRQQTGYALFEHSYLQKDQLKPPEQLVTFLSCLHSYLLALILPDHMFLLALLLPPLPLHVDPEVILPLYLLPLIFAAILYSLHLVWFLSWLAL